MEVRQHSGTHVIRDRCIHALAMERVYDMSLYVHQAISSSYVIILHKANSTSLESGK